MPESDWSKERLLSELATLREKLRRLEAAGEGTATSAVADPELDPSRNHALFAQYSPDVMMRFDRNMRHLYVSPSISQYWPVPAEAFIGKTHREMEMDEAQCEWWESRIQEVFDTGETRSHEFEMELSPGHTHWTWDLYPQIGEDGEVESVVSFAREITEKVHRQELLQQREEQYRLLVENQTDLVVKVDPEGRFEYVSPSYCRMFGKTEEELLGRAFMPLVHDEDRAATEKAMEALLEPPHLAYVEQRAMTREGWRWLAWSDTAVLNDDGEVVSIIGVGRDITPRRAAQSALARRAEFERIVNEISVDFVRRDVAETDQAIRSALELIARYAGVDRAYLFTISEDGRYTSNTHEWCAPGIEPQIEKLQELEISMLPWWMNRLDDNKVIYITDLNELPEDASSTYHLLKSQGIQSLIVVPVWSGNRLVGFIGFDAVREKRGWSDEEQAILSIVANLFSNALAARAADAALREERNLLRTLFDNVPLGIVILTDDRILTGNRALETITGYTLEEITSIDDWFSRIYPDAEYRRHVLEDWNTTDQQTDTQREYTLVSKSGKKKAIEFRASFLSDGRSLITMSDITTRKLMEQALRENEQRFRNLLERMERIPVQGYDQDRRVIFWNAASTDVYGYTAEEALGRRVEDLIIPDTMREQVIGMITTWYNGGPAIEAGEQTLRNKAGKPVQVYSSHLMHVTGSGDKELYCVDIDLSHLRRIEQELLESERRNKAIVSALPDILFRFSGDGRFIDCSVTDDSLLLRPREEFLGKQVYEVLPEWLADLTAEKIKKTLATGELQVYRYSLELEGRERHYEARQVPILNDETLSIVRDITEQKKLEEQLLQAQKLESVGQLAGGIAHDFNNLLTPILGNAELALMELDPSHTVYHDLAEIADTAERAQELVAQLLAFSRKQVMELKAVNLNLIIRAFQKILRRTIREDIEIGYRLSPDLPLVNADVSRLEQVLMNLSVNAQDAMPGGGRITLETSVPNRMPGDKTLQADPSPKEYVRLTISDTGTGMDEETRARIFDPFFTTKEVGKGTGLGLSTAYGIVRQHGGSMQVHSSLGEGSTFVIFLPVSDTTSAPKSESPLELGDLRGNETILIVEDQSSVRHTAARFLKRFGYHVLEAESATKALQRTVKLEHPIDLLLTDVIMPEMNGRRLYEKIAAMVQGLRVIYMSGYTQDIIARHGVLEDGIDFLQKPFTLRSLTEKVREVLDRD
ncbi:PAS domain S-box protein [bacterium]|nr:PAS domain S-box protein [bacterium]